jgi:PAS domain S-box-containing protein
MPVSDQPRDREGQADAERRLGVVEGRRGPFVAAVEATRMPMAITDPQVADNPIIYANASFLELCGYGREEVLGQNYFFLVGERSDPAVAARVEAAMAARRRFVEDVPFHAKDGREVWVSMFVSPVIEDDRVVQHFASFLDIGDRVAREAGAKTLVAPEHAALAVEVGAGKTTIACAALPGFIAWSRAEVMNYPAKSRSM